MTLPVLDDALRARLTAVREEGFAFFDHFDRTVRERGFHSFIASDYDRVQDALAVCRAPGRTFLELGSGSGVITILADLLGFDAAGIELDIELVTTSRAMAERHQSKARFIHGSFFPAGYHYPSAADGAIRTGTLGEGLSGYAALGRALDDFDVVFGFPWGGEAPVLLDLMKRYGSPDALLLMYDVNDGVLAHRHGRRVNLAG